MFGIVPKRKLELGDSPYEFRDVSVKSSLNSLFRTERDRRQLKPLIKQQADNVSKAFFLYQHDFERQVHANLEKPHFFTALHKKRYHRDALNRFCKARKRQPHFPDLQNCSELLINQANEYETAFAQNIRRNMRRWISLHYQFFANPPMSEKAARAHVNKLFSGIVIDRRWRVRVGDETLNLEQLRAPSKFFNLIPALVEINRKIWHEQHWCESLDPGSIPNGLRTFNVVAQKQWGTKYMMYNANAMILLLNKRAKLVNKRNKQLRLVKKPMPTLPLDTPARQVFANVFKITKFEKDDNNGIKCKFALRISTDGVGASIGLSRRVDEKQVSRKKT